MSDLDNNISKLKRHFYSESAKKENLEERKKETEKKVKEIQEEVDTLEKVSILFQKTAQYAREQGKVQIENLTTNSLNYIFDDNSKFEIELTEKRNTSNADFYIVEENENGLVKTNPEISKGGGIVDVVSLALRLAFLENSTKRIEGPLILDEPTKHVSLDHIMEVGDFLLQFSKEMNRQIIMITHNLHLESISDNVYFVEKEDGISKAIKKEGITSP